MPPLQDESFTQLADQERKREDKLRSSRPYVRFAVIVIVILGVVVAGGLIVRNQLQSREVATYRSYMAEVADLVTRTNDVGAKLAALITAPGDATRKDVETRVNQYTKSCADLTADAGALTPPKALQDAHQWLIASMKLRERGLVEFLPSLMSALEVQDTDVPADQLSRAMLKFILADVAYSEFFAAGATGVLTTRGISDIKIVSANFLQDDNLASKSGVVEWLTDLKSAEQLQAIHGVGLIKVITKPSDTEITPNGQFSLSSSDQLRFLVTIENQGTMSETDVPVTLRLQGPNTSQPQIVSVKIPDIKPKESKEIEIKGVHPTDYGEKALLKIDVGPVPNEKNLDNNSLEAHIVFIL